ncbi:MAG: Holliday junction ATP-dependent DNA helicase RuvA [Candidatus Poribacteria bacterium]|nr:Holliday junction ATP-dependent DNA helicase RuvA [Candidatus Poribacteria bacterium]MDE0503666.1 Holliday junction ATP-dependent DNA helicase RuvA [Candidatus Poribacteria bacterium]
MTWISFIRGTLVMQEEREVVVDVHGIGYSLEIPPGTVDESSAIGSEVTFHTHYHQSRENEVKLYGFTSRDDLKVFELALTVKGVGPTLAQNIVSKLSPSEFQRAVIGEDSATLMRVPRLTKELAQLFIIKLKNSIRKVQFEAKSEVQVPTRYSDEGVQALVGLGASEPDAERAMIEAQKALGDDADLQDLIRLALRYI